MSKEKAPVETISKAPADSTLVIDSVEGTITIIHPDGSEVVKKLPVKEVLITKPMCNIGVSAGALYNLGNFNNMKVSVSLHIPAEHHEIEEVYTFAKNWVDEKMNDIHEEVNSLAK